ncbi:hypothetical protein C1645_780596 [Glomus cerebriforme]|uniref:DNA topoisomerase (ATP-hydrolyzing) n=1 Tax=Glomus cerebriforme TaxID=658196 RepID=A0A397SMA3_9GLOM|nr:hypothetical protein C1645_780596 [Glomus cerebriforme]
MGIIMTDQDHDGSHIKGLTINFMDHFFSSLLRIKGFLLDSSHRLLRYEFSKRIINNLKCTKGDIEKSFFAIPEY